MNQEILKQWLEALRSGEYKQTKGALMKSTAYPPSFEKEPERCYCCLGVLTELYRKEKTDFDWELESCSKEKSGKVRGTFIGEKDFLHEDIMNWCGLEEADPGVNFDADDGPDSVADLNDSGRTFADIADMLEATYGEKS